MNEPEKKIDTPSRVGNEPETHDTPATPAAANNDNVKSEPVVGVSPTVDLSGAKKDPVVAVPVADVNNAKPEVVVPPAIIVTPAPANTNETPAAPAAETPAAPAAATPATPAVAGETPPPATPNAPAATDAAPEKKKKGWVKQVFNFAAGAGISFGASLAAKSAVGVALGIAGASTLTTVLVSGFVVGAAVTVARDAWDSHKEGKTLKEYFSKAHWKGFVTSKKTWLTFGISTGGALLGSAVALGWQNGTIQEAWNNFFGNGTTPTPVAPIPVPVEVTQPVVPEVTQPVVPEVVTQPVVPVETAPVEPAVVAPVCLTPGEQFAQLIDGHDVSSRVTDAMTRAASTNPAVAAQGTKDLAYFAFNGFDGVPKDHNVAVELFKQAADAGNAQAKVDLVYMQYHGLGGVTADKTAAIATMKTLPGARAASFIANWGGSGKIAAAAFSSDTVLKGMAVGCPAL